MGDNSQSVCCHSTLRFCPEATTRSRLVSIAVFVFGVSFVVGLNSNNTFGHSVILFQCCYVVLVESFILETDIGKQT